jgi:hypothetical protein
MNPSACYVSACRIPERYSLVIRSLLTQEGICMTLKPEFHFLEVAYPYVARCGAVLVDLRFLCMFCWRVHAHYRSTGSTCILHAFLQTPAALHTCSCVCRFIFVQSLEPVAAPSLN